MIQTSTIYLNEIEDRISAPFYQERYLKPIREFKKAGLPISNLGNLIRSVTNGVEIRKYVKVGTPYIRVSDMKSMFVSLSVVKRVAPTLRNVSKKIKLGEDDILISRSGTPGIASIVTKDIIDTIISSHIIKVEVERRKIDPRFLVIFLNSLPGKIQIDRITNGCLVTEISHGALELIRVPIVSIEQQQKTGLLLEQAILKHIEALNKINQAKQIFEEEININYHDIKEEKAYSVNSEDLTDILTPKFYYPKYLNALKQLKKKFKTVKLDDVADIKRGNEVGSENYKNYINKKDPDVPFIRTSDLVNYEIDNYPDYYIDEEIYKELNQDLKEGDILYTKDGKIGLSAMITQEDKCIIASGVARIRVKKEFDPYYVFLVLSTEIGLYQASQRVVIAATLPHLQSERLAEIEIPLISSQKQKEISKLIGEAFQLKAEKKKLIKQAMEMVENLIKS